jgi:MFS family permease
MTTHVSTVQVPRPVRERLVTPAFVALGLADLAYFTALGVAMYALPFYVTGPIGSDTSGAGLAFGAFAVTALVCRPLAGRLADVRGRRPLLIGGALLCGLGFVLMPHVDGLAWVVALRLLQGVAEASFFVASFAAVADLAPPSRMGEALSYNSLGLYLGITLGPPLGELLLDQGSFTVAWYGAAGLAVIAAVVARSIGETRPADTPASESGGFIHRPAIPASLGFMASVVAMGGFLALASLHAADAGLRNASLALSVYGIVVVGCRLAFAKVPDRLPSLPLGAAALVTIAAGLSTMALWHTPTGLIGGAVLMALGVTFSTPAFFSAIFSTASAAERGAASATASVALDLGLGAGPMLLGLVAESMGIPWAFGVGAGVALAGAGWTLGVQRAREAMA